MPIHTNVVTFLSTRIDIRTNPTTLIYNASFVIFYNATCGLTFFSTLENALAYYNAGVVHSCKLKSRRIGSI
jgi:hypothetical protein